MFEVTISNGLTNHSFFQFTEITKCLFSNKHKQKYVHKTNVTLQNKIKKIHLVLSDAEQ